MANESFIWQQIKYRGIDSLPSKSISQNLFNLVVIVVEYSNPDDFIAMLSLQERTCENFRKKDMAIS